MQAAQALGKADVSSHLAARVLNTGSSHGNTAAKRPSGAAVVCCTCARAQRRQPPLFSLIVCLVCSHAIAWGQGSHLPCANGRTGGGVVVPATRLPRGPQAAAAHVCFGLPIFPFGRRLETDLLDCCGCCCCCCWPPNPLGIPRIVCGTAPVASHHVARQQWVPCVKIRPCPVHAMCPVRTPAAGQGHVDGLKGGMRRGCLQLRRPSLFRPTRPRCACPLDPIPAAAKWAWSMVEEEKGACAQTHAALGRTWHRAQRGRGLTVVPTWPVHGE